MDAISAVKTLTLGEVAAVENLAGISIAELGETATPMGKATAALAYVIKRRSEPEFKFEDALNLTIDEATAVIAGTQADPTG